jgi:23S rRNA (cytosine1962-C5)-methyltransferase
VHEGKGPMAHPVAASSARYARQPMSVRPVPAPPHRPPNGATPGHELLDAGDGRRLERFGTVILDRPAPGASSARRDPAAWSTATARFDRPAGMPAGTWTPVGTVPERWTIEIDGLPVELRPTPAGQVGIFPEHLPVARWAAARSVDLVAAGGSPVAVLNLFAYTGLATLVLARVRAAVVHVDASRPAVAWARRNAELAGLTDRPIRWLVEDATRFALRERRRGRRYAGILLDPPTYGHGPEGGAWRLAADLDPLLEALVPLLEPSGWFVACTAHATGLAGDALESPIRAALGPAASKIATWELALEGRGGARLAAGWAVLATGGETAR